jgi:hypothetical protein
MSKADYRRAEMIYELWDTGSRNVIGTFATREEALAIVRDTIAFSGVAVAESLLLGQEDKAGRSRLTAEGKALISLALKGISDARARAS